MLRILVRAVPVCHILLAAGPVLALAAMHARHHGLHDAEHAHSTAGEGMEGSGGTARLVVAVFCSGAILAFICAHTLHAKDVVSSLFSPSLLLLKSLASPHGLFPQLV